ncbi:HD domain-containing protein [Pseudomonadota bacterium]
MNVIKAKKILEKHYKQQIKEARKLNSNTDTDWVKMKRKHSYQVLTTGKKIINKTPELKSLDKHYIKCAKVIFLLHDIGRFYEIGNKISSNSKIPSDHGNHAVEILKKEKINDPLILLSIKYHNRINLDGLEGELKNLKISKKEREIIIILSKLIRDADKITNFLSFKNEPIFSFKTRELNYSDQLLKSFKAGEFGKRAYEKTIFDTFLIHFCWEYDLSFEESRKILLKKKINESLLKKFFDSVDKVAKEKTGLIKEDKLEEMKEKMIKCGNETKEVLKAKKLL